jgi:hypothetical protein
MALQLFVGPAFAVLEIFVAVPDLVFEDGLVVGLGFWEVGFFVVGGLGLGVGFWKRLVVECGQRTC